ncbi:hypothetical protein ACHAXR_005907, partial [Thalassiosira sp. AJA248-18]
SHPSKDKTQGPAIHRSDSPTHLDHIEDAVNSSLFHLYQQQKTKSSSDNDKPNLPSSQEKIVLNTPQNILHFPPHDRETIGVASNLKRRLQAVANSGDCRRCWLQKRHCVCDYCIPLEGDEETGIPNVNRLFLLTHHKEICLTVDTAKLILAAFPTTTRLVVSGIGREFQPSMGEMLDAVSNAANSGGDDGRKCLILFPTDDAITFDQIREEIRRKKSEMTSLTDVQTTGINNDEDIDKGWDVIVIDGTWSQARKMHSKYFQESGGCLYRVQLSDEAVEVLDRQSNNNIHDDSSGGGASGNDVAKGHQLRRHPIKWREISTLEATRLLLNDMHTDGQFDEHSSAMAYYQEIGNDAAKRQLGPPRVCN